MLERTLPAGLVDEVTEGVKKSVQATNAVFGVTWVHTYMSRDRTKTYCIYEGPSEQAVREANRRNNLPIDQIIEIPDDLPVH